MPVTRRASLRDERGAMIVLFSVVLTLLLFLGSVVVTIGSWYTHGRHLQTKVDASAFAGGGSWAFPCASDIDARIEDFARQYVGPHMKADGTPYLGATTFNPQVGDVQQDQIHAVMNGPDWYDADTNPLPGEKTDPAGSICDAKILDVKGTEQDSPLLWGWLPFFPDIKKKARVRIEEAQGLSGLLPIGVRIPKPQSAAAAFYDEVTGQILEVKNFCEQPGGFGGLPVGLGGWTTLDTSNPLCSSWASVNVGQKTGVAIATSVRPACGTGTPPTGPPCLEDSGWIGQPVNNFCRQASGTVQCWDATGSGSTQVVQSGVQFIRGYDPSGNGNGPPRLLTAYLDAAPASCGGAYFNSVPSTCSARLTVKVHLGTLQGTYPNPSPPPPNFVQPLRASDVQVRYKLGRSDGTTFCDYGTSCDLLTGDPDATGIVTFSTDGSGISPHPELTADSQANAIAIEITVRNTTNLTPGPQCANFNPNCAWFWTGNGIVPQNQADQAAEIVAAPVQRSFSGSVDRTGPLKWLRMTADLTPPCDTPELGLSETAEAASVPAGTRCFYLEMGLQGALAKDQDEPPIAFNLGATGSQRAFLDCDPAAGSNLKTEIQNGCAPLYQPHPFTYSPLCPADNNPAALLGPHPAPWDATNNWPPPQCVVTQTGAGNQVMEGFNLRLFGVQNNPNCPLDNAAFKPGRNYWHDANNNFLDPVTNTYDTFTFAQDTPAPARGNRLQLLNDPRYVTLFFTPYDSFSSSGNETFPIVAFGGFYVTGYGRTTAGGGAWQGGAPEDPCTDGNSGNPFDGSPFGVGNEPPPDLNLGKNQTWVWGHFITPVFPTASGTPSGRICNPGVTFQPCIATLVE